MRKIKLFGIVLLSCVMLSGCGTSKEAAAAREAGITALEAGNNSEAIVSFEKALEESKGKVGDFQLDVLKYRAEAEYKLKDYNAVIHTYDILISVDMERAEYFNVRSMAKAALGQWESALEDYNKAAAMGEANDITLAKAALMSTGLACQEAGELEMAMTLYNQAVTDGMVSSALYNTMGLCKMEEKDYDSALEYFQKGIDLAEADGAAQCKFNQAVTYERKGDFAKALVVMKEYAAQFGSTPEVEKEITFLKTR